MEPERQEGLAGDPFIDTGAVAEPAPEHLPPPRRDAHLSSQHPHTAAESLRFSWLVLGGVALVYWFTQWPLPDWTSSRPDWNFYVVQPLVWLGVAGLAGYAWLRLEDRPRFSRLLTGIALLVGLFHVSILIIAGVIGSFGDSPTAGRLINYPKNLLYITTLLAGAEVARAYLFAVWKRLNRDVAFVAVALVFFVIALPAAQLTPFENLDRLTRIAGGRWVVTLAISILATALVEIGGVGPSWAYRLALLGFEWFSPILPDLGWVALALIGATVPPLSWRLIVGIYGDTAEGEEHVGKEEERDEDEEYDPVVRWMLTGLGTLIAIAFIVLGTGVIGLRMYVIDGISMEPAYDRGDVAIIKDSPDPDSLQVGDVIRFREGGFSVVHRIVDIERGPSGPVFVTQGDNVARPDAPITADQIEGKVVFLLPKIGHLTLWLRG